MFIKSLVRSSCPRAFESSWTLDGRTHGGGTIKTVKRAFFIFEICSANSGCTALSSALWKIESAFDAGKKRDFFAAASGKETRIRCPSTAYREV